MCARACLEPGPLQGLRAQHAVARADFEQKVYDRTQAHAGVEGQPFQRPGLFRWVYAKPVDQLIVGDGERVWIHDRDLNQVTVRYRARSARRPRRFAGSADIEKAFQLSDAGTKDGLEWLEATPLEREAGFEHVRMGFDADELRAMELFDHFGQRTVLRFPNLRRNPKIDKSEFRFEPPKGADVPGRIVADLFGKREPAARPRMRFARARSTRSSASATCSAGQAAAHRVRVGKTAFDDPVGPARVGQDHDRAAHGEGVRRRVHRAVGGVVGRQGHSRGGAGGRAHARFDGRRTILFVDEVHRFNKAQQDASPLTSRKGSHLRRRDHREPVVRGEQRALRAPRFTFWNP